MAHFYCFSNNAYLKTNGTLVHKLTNSELSVLSKSCGKMERNRRESRTKTELITVSLLFENLQGECIILGGEQFLKKKKDK